MRENGQRKEGTMRDPLEISPLAVEEVEALDSLYRRIKDVRVRTRTPIIPSGGRGEDKSISYRQNCTLR